MVRRTPKYSPVKSNTFDFQPTRRTVSPRVNLQSNAKPVLIAGAIRRLKCEMNLYRRTHTEEYLVCLCIQAEVDR
jgi:hypothetical protein